MQKGPIKNRTVRRTQRKQQISQEYKRTAKVTENFTIAKYTNHIWAVTVAITWQQSLDSDRLHPVDNFT